MVTDFIEIQNLKSGSKFIYKMHILKISRCV